MVKRGHEVDLEYSKKKIIDKMNNFFGKLIVEKIKFKIFEDQKNITSNKKLLDKNVTKNRYKDKINDVKNEKIKKSLLELTKVFREK